MFKKIILLLSLSPFLLFAQNSKLFEEYKTILETVHKNRATIPDSPKIEVGSSGVVMHRFDDTTSTILARATVLAKDGVKALLDLTPYDALEQNTFPKAEIIPASGNEVILNYLYNRSLIIAPNNKNFKIVTDHFKNIDWVHPDILAATLAKAYIPNPDHKKFKEICTKNLSGLIFFNIAEKGYFTDCISFKIIKSVTLPELEEGDEIILPFYSRVASSVQKSIFVRKGSDVNDYDAHYKTLLGIE
ncbi:MAG: plasminogen-binding N-terminal domain-containing protein [Campylobacteraceae bacterium]|jgi:hypothetical protein|nr:plasminogen-binding N-terminal domain-containing protein [Campylobacteraceae bacterium]